MTPQLQPKVVVLATLIPGVLFCMAPGPYREDVMPSWDAGNANKL